MRQPQLKDPTKEGSLLNVLSASVKKKRKKEKKKCILFAIVCKAVKFKEKKRKTGKKENPFQHKYILLALCFLAKVKA